MRGRPLLVVAAAASLGGCTHRWQPQTVGVVAPARACPWTRAPSVPAFGTSGLRAIYHLVIQNASHDELAALIHTSAEHSFRLVPVSIVLNGTDTVFARGPAILHSQREVDAEFRAACRLGRGHIYMTHVRYNPAEQPGDIRVR